MPEPGPSSTHRRLEGTFEPSGLPSAVPAVVLPDHLLPTTPGPVPVEVLHAGRGTPAWAWAERVWGDVPGTAVSGDGERPPTFWLTRLTSERLGLGTGPAAVSLVLPDPESFTRVLPLVHDLPGNGEVQVSRGIVDSPTPRIMVRNGVAAWVTLVPRDHVRPGTTRISNHLSAVTAPFGEASADSETVFFRPLVGQGRAGRRRSLLARAHAWARSAAERCLRWFFLAPEQEMRVALAHPDDEHQHLVTMQDVALSRLGVRSGDNVIVRWGAAEVEVTAVADHDPVTPVSAGLTHDPTTPPRPDGMAPHLAVRVPNALRHLIDLPAAAVVTVRRSTRSMLARNLNSLVIPVASLALAGAALNDPNWVLLGCGAAATAALGLSRLRMGSNRAVRLKD
ncbi:hypothetical protein ACH47X_02055 [Promicromonospora kroppenstedtii]|uniref:Uncharacterized protein n=1 Tax=Promicromonospora kroppenstedtii TaxID=440482 RepID=A0ABW7XE67_9MICO